MGLKSFARPYAVRIPEQSCHKYGSNDSTTINNSDNSNNDSSGNDTIINLWHCASRPTLWLSLVLFSTCCFSTGGRTSRASRRFPIAATAAADATTLRYLSWRRKEGIIPFRLLTHFSARLAMRRYRRRDVVRRTRRSMPFSLLSAGVTRQTSRATVFVGSVVLFLSET